MTLEDWEQQKDRELDEQLTTLFRSARPPVPSAGFVSRTMKAVRLAPLPAGRQPLRLPWIVPVGWAALVGAVAAVAYVVILNGPFAARVFTGTIGFILHGSAQLGHVVRAGLALTELFATVGRAIAAAAATREGTTSLVLIAGVAGVSLTALHRLLFSGGEASRWQELS